MEAPSYSSNLLFEKVARYYTWNPASKVPHELLPSGVEDEAAKRKRVEVVGGGNSP